MTSWTHQINSFISTKNNQTTCIVELEDPDSFYANSFDLVYWTKDVSKPICLTQALPDNKIALILSFIAEIKQP